MKSAFLWIATKILNIVAKRMASVLPSSQVEMVAVPDLVPSADINELIVQAAVNDMSERPEEVGSVVMAFNRYSNVWSQKLSSLVQATIQQGGPAHAAGLVMVTYALALGMYIERRLQSANAGNSQPVETAERSANT